MDSKTGHNDNVRKFITTNTVFDMIAEMNGQRSQLGHCEFCTGNMQGQYGYDDDRVRDEGGYGVMHNTCYKKARLLAEQKSRAE